MGRRSRNCSASTYLYLLASNCFWESRLTTNLPQDQSPLNSSHDQHIILDKRYARDPFGKRNDGFLVAALSRVDVDNGLALLRSKDVG